MLTHAFKLLSCVVVAGIMQTASAQKARAGTEPYIGEIMFTAASFCPRGWLEANGKTVLINDQEPLFTLIGTTYGGDGLTTFKLPNLRKEIISHGTYRHEPIKVPMVPCIAVEGVYPNPP